MYRVGLTGGIGSGKTTVANELARLGAVVIDHDRLARAVVAPGTPALADIVARFGPGVVRPGGELDRAALAEVVFGDDAARRDLEAIVHPWVRATAAAAEREVSDPWAIVVHVVPLLVEAGMAGDFDSVVVVDVPEEAQVQRVARRDGRGEAAARARMASQAGRVERLRHADFVVDNSGTTAELMARTAALWQGLRHVQHEAIHQC